MPRTHCIRCGECCLRSSPTLQKADIRLIKDKRIWTRDLYTIRVGELVRDNINNQLKISESELIKIREKDAGKGCIYYTDEDKACRIYEHRPIQCSALACWDEREFMQAYNAPKLSRKVNGEKAVDKIIELLKFDHHLRPFVSEKTGLDPSEMDFVFGRPITETITMFGLQVIRERDGSFFLTAHRAS